MLFAYASRESAISMKKMRKRIKMAVAHHPECRVSYRLHVCNAIPKIIVLQTAPMLSGIPCQQYAVVCTQYILHVIPAGYGATHSPRQEGHSHTVIRQCPGAGPVLNRPWLLPREHRGVHRGKTVGRGVHPATYDTTRMLVVHGQTPFRPYPVE